jgi:type II secretory pathway pseudopilin PulG
MITARGHSSFSKGDIPHLFHCRKWGHSGFSEKPECPQFLPGVSECGFSYVEVLVAMVLIAIALVPATDALQVAMLGSGQHETTAVQHYRAYGRLEELMTEGFATLYDEAIALGSPTAPSSYSDALGTPNRRTTALRPAWIPGLSGCASKSKTARSVSKV